MLRHLILIEPSEAADRRGYSHFKDVETEAYRGNVQGHIAGEVQWKSDRGLLTPDRVFLCLFPLKKFF